jgi:hypothetical protein
MVIPQSNLGSNAVVFAGVDKAVRAPKVAALSTPGSGNFL